jgi:adenosylcobinamide-phosphate synthase
LLLLVACFLDYLIGDPIGWLHPVQVIGWLILWGQKIGINSNNQPRFTPLWMKLWGIFFGLFVMFISATIGYFLCILAWRINPLVGQIIVTIILSACLAGKSLRMAAKEVLSSMDDLSLARKRLSRYVGRDTIDLSAKDILRAVLETVTENGVDGVTAPLFYMMLGYLLFSAFGAVFFGLFYKASSTLDSMIGYKEEPFTDFGWFSAKTEDILTWLPCRLTVFSLGLLSGRPFYVWSICQRDGRKDQSPNSGWSESVYAAILRVQVGGENRYKGKIKNKPLLGEDLEPITPIKIEQALNLTRLCCLVWLSLFSLIFICQRVETLFQDSNLITIFF